MEPIQFTVYGHPEPGGSKRAFVHPHTRRIIVTDANRNAAPWKGIVAAAAAQAINQPLLTGPVHVTMNFYRPRLASHFGTGRNSGTLKATAPAFPTARPDVLKLARAVEDALTGIVWHDDAQIVQEILGKHWGEPARVEVTIISLTASSDPVADKQLALVA
jgi:Holliday junction resolvase RusA-like endonuclease